MRATPYLLGVILGFSLGFGITWDYLHAFKSNAAYTYFLFLPLILLALVYAVSDAERENK